MRGFVLQAYRLIQFINWLVRGSTVMNATNKKATEA